jgi:hypothetical protein
MSRTGFGAPRCYSPNSSCIHETFGSAVNSTVRTMVSRRRDGFSATATDVFQFRTFYSGCVASLHFALVALRKARCDQLPSKLGFSC